jgi:hypothetical protein
MEAGTFPYDRSPLSKEYLAGCSDLSELALGCPECTGGAALPVDQQRWGDTSIRSSARVRLLMVGTGLVGAQAALTAVDLGQVTLGEPMI